MDFTSTGVDLLKQLEGFSPKAYPDSGGKMTIGYGHLIVSGDGVAPGDIIDPVKGTELLTRDAASAVATVNAAVTKSINQNQFNALVIFTYNVGNSAFQNSSLLGLINSGDYSDLAAHWLCWDKVHKNGMFVEVVGLKNRRQAEIDLFNTPVEAA